MFEFRMIPNIKEFRDLVWPTLSLNIMPNNMLLGMVDSRISGAASTPDDRFAVVIQNKLMVGAVAQTIPERPVFSDMPLDAAIFAVNNWSAENGNPKTLFGPESCMAGLFEYFKKTLKNKSPSIERNLSYELTNVIMPKNRPQGSMRFATSLDEDFLVEWGIQFTIDCNVPEAKSPTLRSDTQKKTQLSLSNNARVLWEVDGVPVCMAGSTRKASFGTSVSWVYTPNALRGKGYASQLVAEFSQYLLNNGAPRCLLFTDALNPTSNAIYQRIGYKHSCDFLLLENIR